MKQILRVSRPHWDHARTPAHIREELQKVIDCGTIALGAEVFASKSESKVVFHTCKSRFCTSCGHRATEALQEEMEAILPDVPYVGITLTMPMEFRSVLRRNRCILHGIPAMGAEAIQQWAKARYLTKDTRNKQLVTTQYTYEEFVETLLQHVPDRGRHAMRYFGLLAPRSKAKMWSAVFLLLQQRKQERPKRLSWRWLLLKNFGVDPLIDGYGQLMRWVGRRPSAIVRF